jgi:sulfur-oxidizing protein SoxY
VTFNFGPAAGVRRRPRGSVWPVSRTCIAIARMPDGSFKQARQNVRVTIGGCGG